MLPPDLLEPPGRRGGLRPPSPMPFCEVRFGATLELRRSGGFAGSGRRASAASQAVVDNRSANSAAPTLPPTPLIESRVDRDSGRPNCASAARLNRSGSRSPFPAGSMMRLAMISRTISGWLPRGALARLSSVPRVESKYATLLRNVDFPMIALVKIPGLARWCSLSVGWAAPSALCDVLSLRHFRLARWCSLSLGGWSPKTLARRILAWAARCCSTCPGRAAATGRTTVRSPAAPSPIPL